MDCFAWFPAFSPFISRTKRSITGIFLLACRSCQLARSFTEQKGAFACLYSSTRFPLLFSRVLFIYSFFILASPGIPLGHRHARLHLSPGRGRPGPVRFGYVPPKLLQKG